MNWIHIIGGISYLWIGSTLHFFLAPKKKITSIVIVVFWPFVMLRWLVIYTILLGEDIYKQMKNKK